MAGTPSSVDISPRLDRIANLAKDAPSMAFTTLAHHIDLDFLREAHRRTRKGGAVGVDGQTAKEYASKLDANLSSLLDRAKSGRYRAPPVRRVYIPKGKGELRPLGIPTFEDKVLQRAVTMVLEAIYEQDFLDCSYGFRPGRSAHDALSALHQEVMTMKGGWVLEADIQGFFDSLDHGHLRTILRRRVRDGVLLRLVGKWLNAGVQTEMGRERPRSGSPQGGVISPLLANVYLHEVLDVWFSEQVSPRLKGRARLIRYADDFVIVFSRRNDAERVLSVLPNRFGRYGLTLHPDKTRLVPFRRPPRGGSWRDGVRDAAAPGTFDFLGFTLHWAKSRRGFDVVKLRTSASRLRRTLQRLNAWCRRVRHLPVWWQWKRLCQSLLGHIAYFGISGNFRAVQKVVWLTQVIWRKWLNRRSQRKSMVMQKMRRLLARYPLPRARIVRGLRPTTT